MADNLEETPRKRRRGPYGKRAVQCLVDDFVDRKTCKAAAGPKKNAFDSQVPADAVKGPPLPPSTEHQHITDEGVDSKDEQCVQKENSEVDQLLQDYLQELIEIDADSDNESNAEVENGMSDDEHDETEVSGFLSGDEDCDKEPLYPGASVTLGAVMLLLAVYTTSQSITGEGIELLLKIIALIIPNDHNLCTSLYAFKNYFKSLKNPLVKHYYCRHCLSYVTLSNMDVCPNEMCRKTLTSEKCGYFLEIPLSNQIQTFFAQKHFYGHLQERFSRKKQNDVDDIYDGTLYKSYCDSNGPLSSPDNISFLFNTDGAPVFKSSKVSIWPIFLVINELPYHLRMKKESMILAGLWFGSKKPLFGTFLKPLLTSLKELNDGIICESPERGQFRCKGYLIAGTMDLPARAIVCNSVQYNGAYGCWKCLQPGETAKVGKGHTHIFPFQDCDPKGPQRHHNSVIEDSRYVVEQQKEGKKKVSKNGVKGPSWLLLVPKFNIVSGIAIDYMHGVLLGVQKLLLTLWFAPQHASKAFSFHTCVNAVDERLLRIRPTLEITRLPRTISEEIKYWKASELRSFLLFYGAPVLFGILDEGRFHHYLLLVNAIHILLTSGSSYSSLNNAEQNLILFCSKFASLYDKCYMTLNIHQLLHLADSVRELGPLYTHSCFSFEDKNGFILKMIRGTQSIDNQILMGVSFIQKLPELKHSCISANSEIESLYHKIQSRNSVKRGEKIGQHIFMLGAVSKRQMKKDEYQALLKYLGVCQMTDSLKSFLRVEINGSLIYGLEYGRMLKRNNAAVKINVSARQDKVAKFGLVRYFAEIEGHDCSMKYIAFIEELVCQNPKNCPILQVTKNERLVVVDICCIMESCIFVEVPTAGKSYLCSVPNSLESD